MKDSKQEILNRYGLGMPIKSLAHVCIKATDLDAITEFYCGALGMTKHFNFTKNGKIIGFYMKAASDTFIEVFLADQVEGIDKHVINHFCLETDDIDALRNSLVARGYSPGPLKLGADLTPQFWMKDPYGMDLEFQQYTERSAQFTGKDVEVDW
jgi:catechol 2,3-dioxygenase-like lactoylglutathione lyase family enzyme